MPANAFSTASLLAWSQALAGGLTNLNGVLRIFEEIMISKVRVAKLINCIICGVRLAEQQADDDDEDEGP